MRLFSSAAILSCGLLLAGCSGTSGTMGGSTPAAPGHAGALSSASFVISVPQKSTTASSGVRTPQYVSPATQSINVAISGPTSVSETQDLTIGSSGCTSTLAGLQCTLTVGLLPCPSPPSNCYTATLTTYDQTGAAGNALSTAQAIAFNVAGGSPNAVALTLSGIPHSTVVLPTSSLSVANGSAFDLYYGTGTHTFVVESLDADGNIIAGAGAPLFTIGSPSGTPSGVTTSPATTIASAPNAFTVTLPAVPTSGTASFTVTPTFSGQATDGCTATGASCTPLTVSVNTIPPSGAFTFNPSSPLALTNFVNTSVTVSEGDYMGDFTLSNCSATGGSAACTAYSATHYDCNNYTSPNGNRVDITFTNAGVISYYSNPVGSASALTCVLTINDSFGNSATYTATAPAQP